MRCISQRRRRGETSCRGSLTDHLQVVKLGVVELEVNIPRLVEHAKEDTRVELIGSHVRIPNFAGDDELAILHRSSVVDRLEDLGAHIFGEVKPRIMQVWPEVIDDQHEAQVGKTLGVAFLEVNPETRKLVLSEKKAATALRFRELEVGQLVEGQISAIKPYGFFVDLGGVSGLLHHSSITGAALRDLREAFQQGDRIMALITAVDGKRGRIALNTQLLENQPGELLIAKDQVMGEAAERAARALSILKQREQQALQQDPPISPQQELPSEAAPTGESPVLP